MQNIARNPIAKILLTLMLALVGSCASHEPRNSSQNAVYVLGTIHGNMLAQPKNGVRDFIKAMITFQPTLIISETRSDFPGAIDGTIDGGAEQALVYAFAKQANVTVIPADWFTDAFNILELNEEKQMSPSLKKKIEPLFQRFRTIVQKGTFEDSQSDSMQSLIRARYDLIAEHGFKTERLRSEKICQNIRQHARALSNQRVLVVFGVAHKYALEDCFKVLNIQPLSLRQWYRPEIAKSAMISEGLKTDALQNFAAAKASLKERLDSGYYKTDLENLKDKLSELDLWITKTKEL